MPTATLPTRCTCPKGTTAPPCAYALQQFKAAELYVTQIARGDRKVEREYLKLMADELKNRFPEIAKVFRDAFQALRVGNNVERVGKELVEHVQAGMTLMKMGLDTRGWDGAAGPSRMGNGSSIGMNGVQHSTRDEDRDEREDGIQNGVQAGGQTADTGTQEHADDGIDPDATDEEDALSDDEDTNKAPAVPITPPAIYTEQMNTLSDRHTHREMDAAEGLLAMSRPATAPTLGARQENAQSTNGPFRQAPAGSTEEPIRRSSSARVVKGTSSDARWTLETFGRVPSVGAPDDDDDDDDPSSELDLTTLAIRTNASASSPASISYAAARRNGKRRASSPNNPGRIDLPRRNPAPMLGKGNRPTNSSTVPESIEMPRRTLVPVLGNGVGNQPDGHLSFPGLPSQESGRGGPASEESGRGSPASEVSGSDDPDDLPKRYRAGTAEHAIWEMIEAKKKKHREGDDEDGDVAA